MSDKEEGYPAGAPPAGSPVFTQMLNPGLDRTLTVPEFVWNEVLRATEARVNRGGKGFNVSRALQSLGVASTAMASTLQPGMGVGSLD